MALPFFSLTPIVRIPTPSSTPVFAFEGKPQKGPAPVAAKGKKLGEGKFQTLIDKLHRLC